MEKSKKLSVLLADDDSIILNDLQTIIDWDSLGFRIIGAASNGKKALDLFKCYNPDIVITDIVMPGMDGIELIRQIKKISPDTFFLVLSSYDEFDYAKSAMQLGVSDYLLKMEINEVSLKEKMSDVYEIVASRSSSASMHTLLELQDFFRDPRKEIDKRSSLFSIQNQKYIFMVFTDTYQLRKNMLSSIHQPVFSEKIMENYKNCLSLSENDLIFYFDDFMIIGFANNSPEKYNFPKDCLDQLQNLNRKQDLTTPIFYVEAAIDLIRFRTLFSQVTPELRFQSLFPENPRIKFSSLNTPKTLSRTSITLNYDTVYYQLSQPAGKEWLVQTLKSLYAERVPETCMQLLELICEICDTDEPDALNQFTDFSSFGSLICEIWQCWYDQRNQESPVYSIHVKKALSYIRDHYMDADISVDSIADQIGISGGRLSVLFKKEVGTTPNKYLTDYRINQAIQLLLHTNAKIYEIANAVGYRSSQYFCQIFYAHTGKKPLDYRNFSTTNITIGEDN